MDGENQSWTNLPSILKKKLKPNNLKRSIKGSKLEAIIKKNIKNDLTHKSRIYSMKNERDALREKEKEDFF